MRMERGMAHFFGRSGVLFIIDIYAMLIRWITAARGVHLGVSSPRAWAVGWGLETGSPG